MLAMMVVVAITAALVLVGAVVRLVIATVLTAAVWGRTGNGGGDAGSITSSFGPAN